MKTSPRISLIAAMSQNGVIGKNNTLPWHIPEELKYFKHITQGKPIIMGRKTFESLNSKPLPHRHNIILTHEKNFQVAHSEVTVVHSVQEAIKSASAEVEAKTKVEVGTLTEVTSAGVEAPAGAESEKTQEIMVIGGAAIFQAFLPSANRIYLSIIHQAYEGDTYFPEIDWAQWQLISEENKGSFTAQVFDRHSF